MIKRGDKGTIGDSPARVVADDVAGEYPLAIEVIFKDGVRVLTRKWDGTAWGTASFIPSNSFIPSKPWDSLELGDWCFVRDSQKVPWKPRIFSRINIHGSPMTFCENGIMVWIYCVPAKLIDGELVPVEEE